MKSLQEYIDEKLLINKNFKHLKGLKPDVIMGMFVKNFEYAKYEHMNYNYKAKDLNAYKESFYKLIDMIENNCPKTENSFIYDKKQGHHRRDCEKHKNNECIIIGHATTNKPSSIWFFNEKNEEYMVYAIKNDKIIISKIDHNSINLYIRNDNIITYKLDLDVISLFYKALYESY